MDSEKLRLDATTDFTRDQRLYEATDIVLASTLDSLTELGAAFVLSDANGRILGRWTPDLPVMGWLDSVYAVDGNSYAEDFVGSNAIGTALELGRTTRFDGAEHFVSLFRDFSCVGVPIRDGISQRVRGVLDLTTRAGSGGAIIQLLAEQLARDIETQLIEGAAVRERLLLQRFLQARRRMAGVIAINQRTVMSDPRASRLLGHVDQQALWEHAGSIREKDVIVSREFAALDGVATIDTASTPIYDGADLLGVLIRVHSGRSQTARMVQRANPPLRAIPFN